MADDIKGSNDQWYTPLIVSNPSSTLTGEGASLEGKTLTRKIRDAFGGAMDATNNFSHETEIVGSICKKISKGATFFQIRDEVNLHELSPAGVTIIAQAFRQMGDVGNIFAFALEMEDGSVIEIYAPLLDKKQPMHQALLCEYRARVAQTYAEKIEAIQWFVFLKNVILEDGKENATKFLSQKGENYIYRFANECASFLPAEEPNKKGLKGVACEMTPTFDVDLFALRTLAADFGFSPERDIDYWQTLSRYVHSSIAYMRKIIDIEGDGSFEEYHVIGSEWSRYNLIPAIVQSFRYNGYEVVPIESETVVKQSFFMVHNQLLSILEQEAKEFSGRYRKVYQWVDKWKIMELAAVYSSVLAKLFRTIETFLEDYAVLAWQPEFDIECSLARIYEQGAVNFMAGKQLTIPHVSVSNSIH